MSPDAQTELLEALVDVYRVKYGYMYTNPNANTNGNTNANGSAMEWLLQAQSIINQFPIDWDVDEWVEYMGVSEHTVIEEVLGEIYIQLAGFGVKMEKNHADFNVKDWMLESGLVDVELFELLELDCSVLKSQQYTQLVYLLEKLVVFCKVVATQLQIPLSNPDPNPNDHDHSDHNSNMASLYKYSNTLYTMLLTATTGPSTIISPIPTYSQFYQQSLITVWIHTAMPSGAQLLKGFYIGQTALLRLNRMTHRSLISMQPRMRSVGVFGAWYERVLCNNNNSSSSGSSSSNNNNSEHGVSLTPTLPTPVTPLPMTFASYVALSIEYLSVLLDCVH